GDAGLRRPRGSGGPGVAPVPDRRRDRAAGAAGPGERMTDQEVDAVRRLLHEHSAIVLDDGKQYLVEARLAPLLRQQNLKSIGELLALVCGKSDYGLRRQIIEAMVTTESSFFRDHHPFEALRKVVLPDLIQRRRGERRLQIWCAASS